MQTDGQTETHR